LATFVKTPSGTWKALVRRRGHPARIKTFRLKADALTWATGVEDAMNRADYRDRSLADTTPFATALDRYLDTVTPTKKSDPAKERSLAIPLRAFFKDYSLSSVSQATVADYRDARLATMSVKTDEPMSAATVRRELALLSAIFTTAAQSWNIPLARNPVGGVRLPPIRTRAQRLPADLLRLRDRREPLLAACRAHPNPAVAWIVELALETLMRKSEARGIQKHWVDMYSRTVTLPDTKNNVIRIVPLTVRACEILREALAMSPEETEYVFPNRRGTGPYALDAAWRRARGRAGMDPLHFHDLRHEAISTVTENGAPAQVAAAIAGHSVRTQQRYVSLDGKSLVPWIDKVMPSGAHAIAASMWAPSNDSLHEPVARSRWTGKYVSRPIVRCDASLDNLSEPAAPV
jgi:integrase